MSLLEYHVFAEVLFNADETLMTVNSKGELIFVKLLDSVRKAHHDTALRLNTIGSMIPFVNAAGEVLLVVYCLKAKNGRTHAFNVDLQRELAESNRKVLTSLSLPLGISPYNFFSFAAMVSPNTITAFLTLVSLMGIFGVRFLTSLVAFGRSGTLAWLRRSSLITFGFTRTSILSF